MRFKDKQAVCNVFTVHDNVTVLFLDRKVVFLDKNFDLLKEGGKIHIDMISSYINWIDYCKGDCDPASTDGFIFACEVES